MKFELCSFNHFGAKIMGSRDPGHAKFEVFYGVEPGCWVSPFRLTTKVVVELPI